MASLPPYRAPSADGSADLAQRLGGMSMDHSPVPPQLQPIQPSASPLSSSLEAAMSVPLPPPGSSLASHNLSPLPSAPISPVNAYGDSNDMYGFYNQMPGVPHQHQSNTMPMAPGMEPPFSPVLAPTGAFGFAAMQGMGMQEVPLVHDYQSQFEYGPQGYDFGMGGMQQQQQNGFQQFMPARDQHGQHGRQGQGFGQDPVSPNSVPRQAIFTGTAGKGGRGGGGPGRWGRQAGMTEQTFGFNSNNRFQQPLKSPGRGGAFRTPHSRKGDMAFTPGSGARTAQDGFNKAGQAGQGAWGTPPSLVSDRSVNGTPNTSYPVTPRSRSGSSFTGIPNNNYRNPNVAMPINQYSPQNPYAQQEYYTQVPPGGYGYGGFGSNGKARPWRRFDDQPKSVVLEEFRSGRSNRPWSLKDIAGHIIEFSGDQSGSRLIQERIEQGSDQERQAIFNEIRPNALTLMTDVYGNYCVQKLFEHGSVEQKRFLVDQMLGRVLSLSNQMYGCRVVQTALDHVEPEQRFKLITELDGKYLECVKQANANHVIQRIVLNDPPQFVLDSFRGHVQELALHTFGCRVLQKALETLTEQQLRPLLNELHKSVPMLIEDAFGNYVIQSVISSGPVEDRDKVVQVVKRKVFVYSRHKFASNVVEKAIRHANPQDRLDLVYSLVFYRSEGYHRVPMLLKDPFSNFAFQTALQHAERQQRQQLLDLVVPLLPTLMHTPVGKRISLIVEAMAAEGFHITPAQSNGGVGNGNGNVDGRDHRDLTGSGPEVTIDGRASPVGSDMTETPTEIGTVLGNTRPGGLSSSGSGSASGSTTTISSPTPRHVEPGNVNVGLGINMTGGRELRPTASAPPLPRPERNKDDWRARNTPSPARRGPAIASATASGSTSGRSSPIPVPGQKPLMVPSSVEKGRSLKGTVSMMDVPK